MSDPKRTQNRDISELKARLGLKKPERAPAAQTRGGGVAPPPGIAAPPGIATAPAQPVIPNAADDPFGAMNAMAHLGSVQRAPEIVIVNDGKPVESVSAAQHGTALAKIALIAVVPLVLGVAVGQIAARANFFNDGITASRAILGNVNEVKKRLADLRQNLEDASAKNGLHFAPDLTKKIEQVSAGIDVKTEVVFRAKQSNLNPEIEGMLLGFYAGIAELKSMLDAHYRAAKTDDLLLNTAKKASEGASLSPDRNAFLAGRMAYRYAIVINNPGDEDRKAGGGDYGARLVEIGPPYCGDGKLSNNGSCGDGAPSGFAYRNDAGGVWNKAEVASPGPGEPVPPKTIIPLLRNGAVETFLKGAEAGAADTLYVRRLRAVLELTKKLLDDSNRLGTALEKKANESKKFSFFM